MKSKPFWKPGKVGGVTVRQEIIVPIDFSITGFFIYKGHYNNFWQLNHLIFQQQMMNLQWVNQQITRVPTGRF